MPERYDKYLIKQSKHGYLHKLYECIRIQQLYSVDCIVTLLLASACKDHVITTFGEVLARLKPNARTASSDNNNSSSHAALQTRYCMLRVTTTPNESLLQCKASNITYGNYCSLSIKYDIIFHAVLYRCPSAFAQKLWHFSTLPEKCAITGINVSSGCKSLYLLLLSPSFNTPPVPRSSLLKFN